MALPVLRRASVLLRQVKQMHPDVEKILFTEESIAQRVRSLGKELSERFCDTKPIALCVLRGAAVFFCDLVRAMPIDMELDFIALSSYGEEAKTSGSVTLAQEMRCDVFGRDVMVVEDIVDSGLTLSYIKRKLLERGARSVTTVCLLNKACCHLDADSSDYTGFEIGAEFVVGYGLDYAQGYRNLPYIGILRREIYEKS